MTHLILVRHGEYGSPDRSLTGDGHRQIFNLAERLKPHIQSKKVAILSSTAKRARDTTDALIRVLGESAVIEYHECLASLDDELTSDVVQETIELVEKYEPSFDIIILSTHYPHVAEFLSIWGERFGHKVESGWDNEKGSARMYEKETGNVVEFPALSI